MCVLNHKLTLTQTTKKEGYGVLCWMHSKVTLPGYSALCACFQEKNAVFRINWIVNYFKI